MAAWVRCIDQIRGGTYPLNPAHVVYFHQADGWWRAYDALGRWHTISGDEDGTIEGLMQVKGIVSQGNGLIGQSS